MKVIDLLNKIANGEKVPKKIKWKGVIFDYVEEENYEDYINSNCFSLFEHLGDKNEVYKVTNMLNDEVEIIEEEKKIPEKLPYYSMEKIQKAKNKDEWREERISLLEKRVDDLHIKMNDLLDYLKSKGE